MLKSYLTIVLRSFGKHKGFTLINVLGLAIGIAVCALIFLWVRDELAFDRFHAKGERTYRVLWEARFGSNEWTLAKTPIPLADVLREQFPEIEDVVRFTTDARTMRLDQEWVNEDNILRVEPAFFDVFTIQFLAGDPRTALDDPAGIVLTQEAASRYFGSRDAMGQALELNNGVALRVTGIVESFPAQSHFNFDFLVPLDMRRFQNWQRETWGAPPVYTYFVVRDPDQIATVAARLQEYVDRTVAAEGPFREGENYYRLTFQSLSDIHLRSHVDAELGLNGNIIFVYLFSIIGAFILLLACVNFINLTTARAAGRALEVGIRKVLGSNRTQLVRQFLTESFSYVVCAILLAVLLVELSLPHFNHFSGKSLAIEYSPFALVVLAVMAGAVTLLAGAYPALVLSSFWPIRALKPSPGLGPKRDWLRSGLVIFQFCISIGLMAATLIVQSQLSYVQGKQLGFEREHVLIVESAGALGDRQNAFMRRLRSHARVMATSAAQSLPGRLFDSTVFQPEQPAGFTESSVSYSWVDEGYVDVLGLRIVAGRNFSANHPSDSSGFLINESAAALLGWDDPIGKKLSMGGIHAGPVIGVVEDFHYASLHNQIEPAFFPFVRWTAPTVAVRLRPGKTAESIAEVRQIWDEIVPQRPFSYSFLDQEYDDLYRSEQQMARIFAAFTGLALFIACLGLFGLASYVAVQRTREIGIRKVLGATASSITFLLTREFTMFVLIAFAVAVPLAYVGMNRWLESFAYRIEIGPMVFVLAGIAVLAVAVGSVGFQAVRAALSDPVKSLRYE